MGASEGLQSLCGYSSDPVFPLFSLQLRVLGDRYEFEYGWITFRLVALVCVFHLMSLACFLPRVFILISWLDTPLHFVVTYSILWDTFMITFLHCPPITGLVPHSLFDPWLNFQLDAHIFITRKVKDTFSYSHIFREIRLGHLIIFFSCGARVEG